MSNIPEEYREYARLLLVWQYSLEDIDEEDIPPEVMGLVDFIAEVKMTTEEIRRRIRVNRRSRDADRL